MIWILAVGAQSLALGYVAGRMRPGRRLLDRAYDFVTSGHDRHTPGWWASESVAFATLLLALFAHPCRTVRRIREHRRAEVLMPAPEMDPDWGRR